MSSAEQPLNAGWWTCPACSEWSRDEPTPYLRERECFSHLDEGVPCAWEQTAATFGAGWDNTVLAALRE